MPARSPKRTVARLAVCQMLLLSNGVLMAAVGSLAGYALAPSPRLATVPAVTYVLGAALSTLPASFFMKRRGRRAGFHEHDFAEELSGVPPPRRTRAHVVPHL